MVEMATMTLTGLQELSNLVKKGYTFEVTKSTDGTDIVLATNEVHTRMFTLIITEEE